MAKKEVSYKTSDDAYTISVVPDVVLNANFWGSMAEAEGDERLPYQLAFHEVLMHPGLHFVDWSGKLKLVCPDDDNPKEYRSTNLPKDNLSLALLGRLKGWKLCTIEAYSAEFWLHFYNVANREWQSGMLVTEVGWGTKQHLPCMMCIQEKTEYTTIIWHDGACIFGKNDEKCQKCNEHYLGSECSLCDYVEVSVADAQSNETLRSVIIDGKGGSLVHEYIDESIYEQLFRS